MDKKQSPKSEFVREKIKDKPKNYRRAASKVGMAALCGLVFAVVFCVVLALFLPIILRRIRTDDGQVAQSQESQDSEEDSEEETEEETQDEASEVSEEETESTTVVEVPSEITIDDYQTLQNELYAIGTRVNKSIVTITSVVSDTDWFNNSYEREGQGSGTIIGETDDAFLILTEHKVITDASKLSVTFIDDASAPAELVKYDGNTGIAVISVDKGELEASTISAAAVIEEGNSNAIKDGALVIALGSPLGTNYSILTGNITATN
ncbi:MAG: S1C family serine protease, partial [Clostridiales bacterium]|nr:S1C family serine protease [Clostridiales bacterium]